jgi:alginate O-acetyltransferase complex protein AlgI
VPLPLGISFFTLQQVAYLVDPHRGDKVDRDPLHYPLFAAFFPHLITGPLIHYGEYARQLAAVGQRPLAADWAVGATVFTIGLARKVLVADNLAPLANPAFVVAAAGTVPDLASAWLAALAWSLQLYFDFSGYSDMAIGLARMFGIVFPLNFA